MELVLDCSYPIFHRYFSPLSADLGSAEKRSLEDVCSEVPEKEAHCGHSPTRAHLLREEDHVEGTLPLYC